MEWWERERRNDRVKEAVRSALTLLIIGAVSALGAALVLVPIYLAFR